MEDQGIDVPSVDQLPEDRHSVRSHWIRRPLVWGAVACLGVILLAAGLFGPSVYIRLSTRDRTFEATSAGIPTDGRVVLVLGARVKESGALSAMLEDRVLTAMDLYRRGVATKLLMSGDNNQRSYDEVTAMRRFAVERGIPGRDVVRDFAGLRTFDSMIRARDIFGQQKLIIVTQRFHLPRALYLARALGLDAVGVVADRRPYSGRSLRRSESREILACVGAVVDTLWPYRGPQIGGPPEGLDGDAQSVRYQEQIH
jgi:SanA protein